MNLVQIIPFPLYFIFCKILSNAKQQSKIQKLYAGVVVDWHNSWERTENTPNALSLQRGMELIAFNLGGWTNFIYLELGKQIRSYIFSWLARCLSPRGEEGRDGAQCRNQFLPELFMGRWTCVWTLAFVYLYLCFCICLTLCQNWGDEPAFGPSKLKALVQTSKKILIEDRDVFGKLDIQKHQ